MTVLNVTMHEDGSAYVQQRHTAGTWSYDLQTEAIDSARECCQSRQVAFPAACDNCPCIACEVAKVALRWRAQRAG